MRESVVLHDMLLIPSGSETTVEGLSDENPIVLQGVKQVHFEWMLWMFYNELSRQFDFCSWSRAPFFVRSADQVVTQQKLYEPHSLRGEMGSYHISCRQVAVREDG